MFGKMDEEMARLRIAEARKNGLHEQYLNRNMYRKHGISSKNILAVVFLAIFLAITLGF